MWHIIPFVRQRLANVKDHIAVIVGDRHNPAITCQGQVYLTGLIVGLNIGQTGAGDLIKDAIRDKIEPFPANFDAIASAGAVDCPFSVAGGQGGHQSREIFVLSRDERDVLSLNGRGRQGQRNGQEEWFHAASFFTSLRASSSSAN